MSDKIDITIEEDGTVTVETDGISDQNHMSADEFLRDVEKLVGGERVTKKKRHVHRHVVGGLRVKHRH